jgi:hypothetical protein
MHFHFPLELPIKILKGEHVHILLYVICLPLVFEGKNDMVLLNDSEYYMD